MKSGPTLALATFMPRARSAAIRPVAIVVLPTPDATPAMTSARPERRRQYSMPFIAVMSSS